jgi:branched-chain amino acid transport system permease protein
MAPPRGWPLGAEPPEVGLSVLGAKANRPPAIGLATGIRLPLLLGALLLAAYPLVLGTPYTLRVLTVAGVYALLVVGYQFVFGHAGALSLAQGTFFGLGAYVTGILGSQLAWTFLATFPLSALLPLVLAALIAVPVLRLETHYFALATLGIGQVVLLVAVNWERVTGGANGIPGVPGIVLFGTTVGRGLPVLAVVWTLVALGTLLAWQLTRGLVGDAFRVMRENDIAALSIGIDVGRLRFQAFLLSAVYAGAAGALYVHSIGVVSPDALEFPVMVACLTIAVVGGRARLSGAILGAVLLVHLPEWFRFLEKSYLIAYGAALLLMITVAPWGLVGAIERLVARLWPPPPPPARPPRPLPPRAGAAGGAAPLLVVSDLTVAFGGVRAVDDVSVTVPRGDILGLIGPNGSGKTTLVNLITGFYAPARGRVLLSGADVTGAPADVIARRGVGRTFQSAQLVDDMTALDSVAVARAAAAGVGLRDALATGVRDVRRAHARAEALGLLEALGVGDVAWRACGGLPHGVKRRVEIARALALEPELLILDEPAAGLSDAEQADLARRLTALHASGLTLLVIEHNMPFLMPLARRVICLDEGRVIAEGPPNAIQADPGVIQAYLGASGP